MLKLIAGPCVIENFAQTYQIATKKHTEFLTNSTDY